MSHSQTSPMIVNLEEIIMDYAKKFDLVKDVKNKVDWDKLCPADFNLSKLLISYSPAEHELNNDPRAIGKVEKSYVVFTSVFTNNTERLQSHNLRCERRTKSICRLTVTRSIAIGLELKLGLTPPNPIIQANAGFTSTFNVSNSNEATFEEELVWSLDSKIEVQPGTKTKADLVIKEDEYDGRFKVEAIIEGSVFVKLRHKETGNILTVISCSDVSQIFTPDKGFIQISKGKVKFVNMGNCFCRYGIEQKVDLLQLPLDEK